MMTVRFPDGTSVLRNEGKEFATLQSFMGRVMKQQLKWAARESLKKGRAVR